MSTEGLGVQPLVGRKETFSEKVNAWLTEYGQIALIVLALGGYIAMAWKFNDMIMARAEKEIELQGEISELKGKMEILMSDKLKAEVIVVTATPTITPSLQTIPTPTPTP